MHAATARGRRQLGVSMLELVLFIVIVGIGVTGILMVMSYTTGRSADPMFQAQAKFVAESYLDEILLKPFVDPASNSVCPAAPANRAAYDNVCDYNGLANSGAIDQIGTPIAGLEGYSVAVAVSGDGSVALNTVNNAGAVRVLRVDVTVTSPDGAGITLTGYRTNFNCFNAADPGCRPL